MEKQYYLPSADGKREAWATNFAAKLPTYAAKYGITPAEIDDVAQGAQAFSVILEYQHQFEQFVEKITSYKNALRNGLEVGQTLNPLAVPKPAPPDSAVLPGIFKRMTDVVNQIKLHPAYSPADGNDLGIEGATAARPDDEVLKPVLKVKLGAGGHPEIKTPMRGLKAVEYQVDRGAGWQFLTIATKARVLDGAPLPAVGDSALWRYRAMYRIDDAPAGQWSDVVSVAVVG